MSERGRSTNDAGRVSSNLSIRRDQYAVYAKAKAMTEDELDGTLSDEQFMRMMVMEACRALVRPSEDAAKRLIGNKAVREDGDGVQITG